MGHLEYNKASQKARWKKKVNNNGTKIYAYAYSLRKMCDTMGTIRIGRIINSRNRDKMGEQSVHMGYSKKRKWTKDKKKSIRNKKQKQRSTKKNKVIKDRERRRGKYRKNSTVRKIIKVMYGKYGAHNRPSGLLVNTSVHTVHKYGKQQHSRGPMARGGSMRKYRIVAARMWPGSLESL